MKKAALVLSLLIGFSFASNATYNIAGKRTAGGVVGGIKVIVCKGSEGICVTIITKAYDEPGYTAFTYNPNGTVAEEFTCYGYAVKDSAPGETTVSLNLLP